MYTTSYCVSKHLWDFDLYEFVHTVFLSIPQKGLLKAKNIKSFWNNYLILDAVLVNPVK